MKTEERKILDDSLVKLFKITPEDLSSLYNDDGDLTDFSAVTKLDSERIQRFTTEKNDQYKRGIKESAVKFERDIKEKYGVESELLGIDLVDHVINERVSEAKSSESIKEHPEFLKARSEWVREQKARDKEWEKKLSDKDIEFERAKTFDFVKSKADSILGELKPLFPSNPVVASNIKNLFFSELEKGNYRRQDEDILVFDKDNNPIKDTHGYPKTFNDFTKDIADKFFEYQTAEPRSSAGNTEPRKPGQGSLPKTEQERIQLLQDPKITPLRRKELTELVIK